MIKEETARAQPKASTCEWRQQRTNRDTGEAWLFQYDPLGNLLTVGLPNGDLVEYLVDGMGRRVGKKKNGVLLKQWIYRDALKPVAELDGAGALVSEFVYGAKSNVPDYVRRGGNTYRVISDHLGSPRYVVNVANSADVPFTATYTSFGEVTGTGLDWVPFGFAGGTYDTDSELVRFGARDYSPQLGRWCTKDPIRFAAARANIYSYVGNDPVNRRDDSGLKDIVKCAATTFICRLTCPVSYTPQTFTACMVCLATATWACKDMDLDPPEPDGPDPTCPPGKVFDGLQCVDDPEPLDCPSHQCCRNQNTGKAYDCGNMCSDPAGP